MVAATLRSVLGMTTVLPTVAPDPRAICTSAGGGGGGVGDINVNDIAAAKTELYKSLDVDDFIYFVNPPHLKSIPQIDHAHIFIRLADC